MRKRSSCTTFSTEQCHRISPAVRKLFSVKPPARSDHSGASGVNLVRRLVRSDHIEVTLAGCLAGLVVVLDLTTDRPWQGGVLDLAACAAAALTPRLPRLAGITLGAIVATYIVIPPQWATLGEYALLIPILGAGMRGATRLRTVLSVAYFVVMMGVSAADAAAWKASPVGGWIAWAVLIAALWLIGNVVVAMATAQERARQADVLQQQRVLARELHDTVARSLTTVVMAAERAKLRGNPTAADLDLIADSASTGLRDLRWVMTLLADPVGTESLPIDRRTPLAQALQKADGRLQHLGFAVTRSVTGDLGRLTSAQADLLGAAAEEAVGNIIAHGDPAAGGAIIVTISDDEAELVFLNRPRADEQPTDQAHLGLTTMAERLAASGGRVATEEGPGQWITRVLLPLAAAEQPEQVA